MAKKARFRVGQLVKLTDGHDSIIHKVISKRINSHGYWYYKISGISGEWSETDLKKGKR